MKTRILSIAILVTLGALIFSCGTNNGQTEELDINTIRTQAIATYASSMTETLVAIPSPSPTLRVEPTGTSLVTVTIEPSPTTNPCYNLLYLADITIPDGTQMKAGEVFTKTWQVQNIGGCAWRAGFTFQHVGGDPMRGTPITLTESIPTGAKRELSIELVVPSGLNGLVQSSWRMADENGVFFGDTLSVNIMVGAVPTNTP